MWVYEISDEACVSVVISAYIEIHIGTRQSSFSIDKNKNSIVNFTDVKFIHPSLKLVTEY